MNDELPPDLREMILRSRGEDEPTEADRGRVRRKLAVAIAPLVGAGGASVLAESTAAAATTASSVATSGSSTVASVPSWAAPSAVAAGSSTTAVTTGSAIAKGGAAVTAKVGGALGIALGKWLGGAAVVVGVSVGVYQTAGNTAASPPPETQFAQPPEPGLPNRAPQSALTRKSPDPQPPAPTATPDTPATSTATEQRHPIPNSYRAPASEPASTSGNAASTRAGTGATLTRPSQLRAASTEARSHSEVDLLTFAQRKLNEGSAATALDLIGEHRHEFPDSALLAERLVVSVLAYCALGQTAQAHAAYDAFVRVAPSSPLRPRLSASCVKDLRTIPPLTGN